MPVKLQLATHLPAVAEYLWQHFFQDPSSDECTERRAQLQDFMAGKGSIDDLFDMVVAQPVNAAMPCDPQHAVTPPVFVQIDALDELKAGLGRIQFLQLVGKLLPSLPPHVRIIITSRPEKDIMEHLVHRIRWVMHLGISWLLLWFVQGSPGAVLLKCTSACFFPMGFYLGGKRD